MALRGVEGGERKQEREEEGSWKLTEEEEKELISMAGGDTSKDSRKQKREVSQKVRAMKGTIITEVQTPQRELSKEEELRAKEEELRAKDEELDAKDEEILAKEEESMTKEVGAYVNAHNYLLAELKKQYPEEDFSWMDQLAPEAEEESDEEPKRERGGENQRVDDIPGEQAGGDPPAE
ncbi:stress response protein NST1-like [Hevea brasiliensis]|uniref:stress response protein NST1-like n=1 Tax=Hevea brasiliensis TaxID=3981 RepID=UPI0025CED7FA|nr:stress response protein NST1-like [Hevea brasiliensis]